MICQLCLDEYEKLCQAHIIPKSFIRFMYPDGKINGKSLLMVMENEDYAKQRRVGIYDDSILCQTCDNWIGREFDEYGKDIFLDSVPEAARSASDVSATFFKDTNIEKIKVFILSVFWRFVISKTDGTISVILPDEYTKRLREIIVNSSPGDINDFSVIITKFIYKDPDANLKKVFQVPVKIRLNDGTNWWILYIPNGFKIFIKVDQRKLNDHLLLFALAVGKPAYVLNYEEFKRTREYELLLNNIYKVKL